MLDFMPRMRHSMFMKRKVEAKLIKKWAQSVGGSGEAAKILIEATNMAPDTATKIVRGNYPSEPQYLIRKALCQLSGFTEDELFPFVGAKGRAS